MAKDIRSRPRTAAPKVRSWEAAAGEGGSAPVTAVTREGSINHLQGVLARNEQTKEELIARAKQWGWTPSKRPSKRPQSAPLSSVVDLDDIGSIMHTFTENLDPEVLPGLDPEGPLGSTPLRRSKSRQAIGQNSSDIDIGGRSHVWAPARLASPMKAGRPSSALRLQLRGSGEEGKGDAEKEVIMYTARVPSSTVPMQATDAARTTDRPTRTDPLIRRPGSAGAQRGGASGELDDGRGGLLQQVPATPTAVAFGAVRIALIFTGGGTAELARENAELCGGEFGSS